MNRPFSIFAALVLTVLFVLLSKGVAMLAGGDWRDAFVFMFLIEGYRKARRTHVTVTKEDLTND